jgi:hypothetical protein
LHLPQLEARCRGNRPQREYERGSQLHGLLDGELHGKHGQ